MKNKINCHNSVLCEGSLTQAWTVDMWSWLNQHHKTCLISMTKKTVAKKRLKFSMKSIWKASEQWQIAQVSLIHQEERIAFWRPRSSMK